MSASGYRAVCSLCQTVLVSSLPHGRFRTYEEAAKVMHAHLIHRCEQVREPLRPREREHVAHQSIEVIEGAA